MVHCPTRTDRSMGTGANPEIIAMLPVDRVVARISSRLAGPVGHLVVMPTRAIKGCYGQFVHIGGRIVVGHDQDATRSGVGERRAGFYDQTVKRQMGGLIWPTKHGFEITLPRLQLLVGPPEDEVEADVIEPGRLGIAERVGYIARLMLASESAQPAPVECLGADAEPVHTRRRDIRRGDLR